MCRVESYRNPLLISPPPSPSYVSRFTIIKIDVYIYGGQEGGYLTIFSLS